MRQVERLAAAQQQQLLDARCSQPAARSPQLPAGEPRSFCPPRWSAVCSRHIYSPLQPSPVAPARATKCWPGFCAKAHPGNSTAQQSRGAESTRCPGTRRRDGRSPAARSAAGGRPARRVAEPPRPSARQAAIPSNKVSLSLSLSLAVSSRAPHASHSNTPPSLSQAGKQVSMSACACGG